MVQVDVVAVALYVDRRQDEVGVAIEHSADVPLAIDAASVVA